MGAVEAGGRLVEEALATKLRQNQERLRSALVKRPPPRRSPHLKTQTPSRRSQKAVPSMVSHKNGGVLDLAEATRELLSWVEGVLGSAKEAGQADEKLDSHAEAEATLTKAASEKSAAGDGVGESTGGGHHRPSRRSTCRTRPSRLSNLEHDCPSEVVSDGDGDSEDEKADDDEASVERRTIVAFENRSSFGSRSDAPLFRKAFLRFAYCGEVASDQLAMILEDSGVCCPQQAWVDVILEQLFGGRSFLELGDFESFHFAYTDKSQKFLQEQFDTADLDSSGKLDIEFLLRGEAITPLPNMAAKLMSEVCGEGDLDLERFAKLLDIVRVRAAFSTAEAQHLQDAFNRFGHHDTEMDEIGLRRALHWLGFSDQTAAAAQTYLPQMSLTPKAPHRSGSDGENPLGARKGVVALRLGPFIRLVRKLYEHELSQLTKLVGQGGKLARAHLLVTFENLGYREATPEAVANELALTLAAVRGAEALGAEAEPRVSIGEAYLALERLRYASGLSGKEMAEAEEAFGIASNGVERIGLKTAARAVRRLSYPLNRYVLLDFSEQLGLSDDGTIDWHGFIRLIARVRGAEVVRIRNLFKAEGHRITSRSDLVDLMPTFVALGYNPGLNGERFLEEKIAEGNFGHLYAGVWGAVRLLQAYRARDSLRTKVEEGFQEADVLRMRKEFDCRTNGKDYIERKALGGLLLHLFPDAAKSKRDHRRATHLLKTADKNGDSMIDWEEFLFMMRMFTDDCLFESMALEHKYEQACGFTPAEVAEFREIFAASDEDMSGDLSLSEVEDMLGLIFFPSAPTDEAKDMLRTELRGKLDEVDTDKSGALDFKEFLKMMQNMVDSDWNGILAAAAVAARPGACSRWPPTVSESGVQIVADGIAGGRRTSWSSREAWRQPKDAA